MDYLHQYGDFKIFGAAFRRKRINFMHHGRFMEERKNAKEIWKQEMRDKNPRMITDVDGTPKEITQVKLLKDCKITWQGDSVIVHN